MSRTLAEWEMPQIVIHPALYGERGQRSIFAFSIALLARTAGLFEPRPFTDREALPITRKSSNWKTPRVYSTVRRDFIGG